MNLTINHKKKPSWGPTQSEASKKASQGNDCEEVFWETYASVVRGTYLTAPPQGLWGMHYFIFQTHLLCFRCGTMKQ